MVRFRFKNADCRIQILTLKKGRKSFSFATHPLHIHYLDHTSVVAGLMRVQPGLLVVVLPHRGLGNAGGAHLSTVGRPEPVCIVGMVFILSNYLKLNRLDF